LFAYLLGEGRGTIAGAFLGAFALTVRASSPLRQKFWFWLAILVLAALHIFVVTAFSWSAAAHWTGLTLMPFMAADIGLLLAIVLFIYRLVYGSPARLFTSPEKRYAEDVE
jgi:membrane protein implicated in regulation of membrane protease activity